MNKQKAELKLIYKEDFEIVQEIVNDFDPCGLIKSGSPINEYESLTNQVLSATYNGKTRSEIKELILHELEHHFGMIGFEIIDNPNKINFFKQIENLIDKLEKLKENKPSH